MILFNINDPARLIVLVPFIQRLLADGYALKICTDNDLVSKSLHEHFSPLLLSITEESNSWKVESFWSLLLTKIGSVFKNRVALHYVSLTFNFIGLPNPFEKAVLAKFRNLKHKAESVINFNKVSVVVSLSDRNLWLDLVVAKICEDYNLTNVIPFTTHLAGRERLIKHSKFSSFNGKYYFPYHLQDALESVFDPGRDYFQIGCSPNSVLCANSPWMLTRSGFSEMEESKIKVCGDLNFLRFSSVNSERKSRVLFSVPQFFEHGLMARTDAYFEIEKILIWLRSLKIEIVAVLHPRSKITDYIALFESFGVRVHGSDEMSFYLQQCSLFVCTYSTTHEWALELGIPCVMLDHYFGFSSEDGFRDDPLLHVTNLGDAFPDRAKVMDMLDKSSRNSEHLALSDLGDFAYRRHVELLEAESSRS